MARPDVTVVVREAGPGDAERLAAVGRATFLETFAGILDGADILAHCGQEHAPSLYADWLDKPDARAKDDVVFYL